MDPFLLKLVLSFVVGGSWIAAVTVLAERHGTKVGGLIGGIPSTVIVTYFFIGWTQGPDQVLQATTIFPLAFSVNSVFFIVYVVLAPKGLILGTAGATSAWFALQALLYLAHPDSFALSMLGWFSILVVSLVILERGLGGAARGRVPVSANLQQKALRALFAGTMISLAVVMSKVGGPVLGGILSSFPANNISTLLITARSVDVDFSRSIATPLMVSAGTNCVAFVVALRCAITRLDLTPATAAAFAASLVSAALVYFFVLPRLR